MKGNYFIRYFILIIIGGILIAIISQFTTLDNANGIASGVFVFIILIWSFFSFRKNLQILKHLPIKNDIPQDLVINGMRLNLTVRTIAWYKLFFWSFLYFLILILAYELWMEPVIKRQKEIETWSIKNKHEIILAPFYELIKAEGYSYKPLKPISIYRRGKILPINASSNKIDDVFFKLPEQLRPADTSEVGTIIKLYREQEIIGTYTDKTTAYHKYIKVIFIDITTHEIIGEETVYGVLPPDSKKHKGDDAGGNPDNSLIRLLEELPIRQ